MVKQREAMKPTEKPVAREWPSDVSVGSILLTKNPPSHLSFRDAVIEHNAFYAWATALEARLAEAERQLTDARLEANGFRSIVVDWRGKYDAALVETQALRAQRDAAVEALRRRAVGSVAIAGEQWEGCSQCGGMWKPGASEDHTEGCIAAVLTAPSSAKATEDKQEDGNG